MNVPTELRGVIVANLALALVAAWRQQHEGPATLTGHAGQMRVEARNHDDNTTHR